YSRDFLQQPCRIDVLSSLLHLVSRSWSLLLGGLGSTTVRPPDGRAQELQPKEQGQEKLPANPDVLVGDAGIRQRRTTQWGSADRRADRPPPGKCVRRPAAGGEDDLCAGRFGVLLQGGGGRLP